MPAGIYVWKLDGIPKYVGQGQDVENRMLQDHRGSKVLYRAVQKYGYNAFEKEIIGYCEIEELDHWETYYIKELSTHISEGGYNISWGGEAPMRGLNHSEETIQRMRNSKLGRRHSEKTKKKISESLLGENHHLFGKHLPEETRNKQSKTTIGKKRSNATSKYFGVSFWKKGGLWCVQIYRSGKMLYRKTFESEIDAAHDYNDYVIANNLPYPLNQF